LRFVREAVEKRLDAVHLETIVRTAEFLEQSQVVKGVLSATGAPVAFVN
jgi:hypothetical protein